MEYALKRRKLKIGKMILLLLLTIILSVLAVIFIETAIYTKKLNDLKTYGSVNVAYNPKTTIAFCIKENNNKYLVLYYNKGLKNSKGELIEFTTSTPKYLTKNECEALKNIKVKKVVYNSPKAHIFSIMPTHYFIIGTYFILVINLFAFIIIYIDIKYKKMHENQKNNKKMLN